MDFASKMEQRICKTFGATPAFFVATRKKNYVTYSNRETCNQSVRISLWPRFAMIGKIPSSACAQMRGLHWFSARTRNNDPIKNFENQDLHPIDHLSLRHTSEIGAGVAQSALLFVQQIPFADEK